MTDSSIKKHAHIEDFNKGQHSIKPLERKPFNLDARRQMTIFHGLRYVAFGLLTLIVLFLGSRYLGDLAVSAAYPNVPLTWIGFSAIMYLALSVLILPLDFYTRFNLGIKSGLHSMPWFNVVGRWVRVTFIDTIGWAFLSYVTFELYANPWFMGDKIKAITDAVFSYTFSNSRSHGYYSLLLLFHFGLSSETRSCSSPAMASQRHQNSMRTAER